MLLSTPLHRLDIKNSAFASKSAIPTLDPGLAQDSSSIEVIEQLFLGLTDYDQTYEVIPELAAKWSLGQPHLYLRNAKDVFWSDGVPVTFMT